jgi:putative OPT family oligopeptide transporter
MTFIMIVTGFLFCAVSAYMAGLVGTSNNPVSGMTIGTILFSALVLLVLMGPNAATGPVAAIMIGAVVCCAACIAGDNLQDLKCGYIVGATPWRQQVMLAIGAFASALVMAPVLNVLAVAYGIGIRTAEQPQALLAPQATLMASVAQGMFGGSLPWFTIGVGAAIGVAIIVVDEVLKAKGAKFRMPVLAAAVGIYLPLELSVPIFAGGLLAWFCERTLTASARRTTPEDAERLGRKGMLFAAGVITGEALMGIVIAVAIWLTERPDALALPEAFRLGPAAAEWIGLAVLALLGYWLYRTATSASARQT